jgi:ubiquinol-cytochrome c reductase iron-sulfur subunit
MANEGVNNGRRRFLTATTAVVGAAGAAAGGYAFLSTWKPSARAQGAGAPVEVDISKLDLEPGARMTIQWRGKPVWIFKRSGEQLGVLPTLPKRISRRVYAGCS